MTEPIHLLDDLGAEFARIAGEAESTPRTRRSVPVRALAIAAGIVLVVAAAAYAVPATRGAVSGVVDSFAGWVSGASDEAPGRAVRPDDDVPDWFHEGGEARLIAREGGASLYVSRVESDEGPWLSFGMGQGVGRAIGDTLERWRERLGAHSVVVLGPANFGPRDFVDDHGRFALLGITAPDVERVELRYFEGPPLVDSVGDGGFVALPDAWRRLREVVAYDGAGRVVGREDVSEPDSRYVCEKEPAVCPPDG
jgi:hypothetical protein